MTSPSPRAYGDRLVVASHEPIGGGDGRRIAVARGDRRGAGAKPLARIDVPPYLCSFANGHLLTLTNGAFDPGGLAVVALYECGGSARTRVAILRF